jgi:hypothetical protein
MLSACSAADCSSPEGELRASFATRLQVLEQLRYMSDQDASVIRIAPTFTRLKDDWSWPRAEDKLGFSTARWDEYRRLFALAGATEGLERGESALLLTTKACGLGISGKSFGYAYLEKPPPVALPKLEAQRTQGIGYVPLERNWYMFVWGT